MTAALEGGEWSAASPGRTLPSGNTRYPLYRRLGGPQGRSGWAKNLVPTGTRSRTVQPVAQSLNRLSYPHREYHKEKYGSCLICKLWRFLCKKLETRVSTLSHLYPYFRKKKSKQNTVLKILDFLRGIFKSQLQKSLQLWRSQFCPTCFCYLICCST